MNEILYYIIMIWLEVAAILVIAVMAGSLIDTVQRCRKLDKGMEVRAADGKLAGDYNDIWGGMALKFSPLLVAAIFWPLILFLIVGQTIKK